MSYSNNKYETYKIEDWVVDDDFISFVNGSANPLILDLSSHPKHSDNMKEAKGLILNLNSQTPLVLDSKLEEIFSNINQTIDDKKDKNKSSLVLKRLAWVGGIAASIALLLFLLPGLSSDMQQYATMVGDKETIELPDHSIVELNNSSALEFNKSDWDRKVYLDGEAFFKVEKGSKFTVSTKQGSVSVLGTQFNVMERAGIFEVECLEGMVEVKLENGGKFKLVAGDKLSDFNNNQVPVVKNEVVKEIDWLNNFVRIDSMDLGFVFDEVGRYYKVEFTNDQSIRGKSYEGFFTTSSLDSAIYQILWPLGINYEIEGNKVIIK